MSVSSAGSQASVSFRGEEVNYNDAMDQVYRELVGHLNHSQLLLRQVALACEQDLPFEEELKIATAFDDDQRNMEFLIDAQRGMMTELISIPDTPEDKILLKKWKIDRKEKERVRQAEHAAQVKADMVAYKLAKKGLDPIAENKMED